MKTTKKTANKNLSLNKIFSPIISTATILMMVFSSFAALIPTTLAAPGYLMGPVVLKVTGALELSVSGSASANEYVGSGMNQQFVSIDWGDGVRNQFLLDGSDSRFTTNSTDKPKTFNTSWTPISHTYTSAGTKTIFVKVHHQSWNGNGEGDGSEFTADVFIPPAALNVIKHVVNNNGGTKFAYDFTINVSGTNASPSSFTGLESPGQIVSLDLGSYSVSEAAVTGYSGATSSDCSGTIASGETKTCTITNDDIPPVLSPGTLTVYKQVINGYDGQATPSEFTISVSNDTPSSFPGSDQGTQVSIPAGSSYSVSETGGPIGYSANIPESCSGTMAPSGDVTCTITNTQLDPHADQGTITVVKNVINDNGGTATTADFPLYINQTSVSNGQSNYFDEGNHVISEDMNVLGYENTGTVCVDGNVTTQGSSVHLDAGHAITCTVTNDDMVPTLTLVKSVVNNNGGTAIAGNWTLTATGPTTISGTGTVTSGSSFKAGEYTLSESNGPEGYTASPWSCEGGTLNGNKLLLTLDETATCTITNNNIQPKLTVTKIVDGGDKHISDFPLFVNQVSVVSGEQNGFNAGQYTISETNQTNYTAIFSGDCDSQTHQVTLGIGDQKTCTIINTYVPPEQPTGSLTICKYEDKDVIGQYENGIDTPLAWGMTVTHPDESTSTAATNGETGCVTIPGLLFGDYSITEASQANWIRSYPADSSTQTTNINIEVRNPSMYFLNYYQAPLPPPPPPPPSDGGTGGSTDTGGGGGNGPIAQGDAYANWLAQQAAAGQPAPRSEVAGATTPQGEVKGASTFLPATGFDLKEALMLLASLLSLIGLAVVVKKKYSFSRLDF